MGAGTTTAAVFLGGRFIHSEGFGLGGHNVTLDIARGLERERRRRRANQDVYGSVLVGGSDERDMIKVPAVGDEREQAQFVPRSALVHIIKPRVEEILEMVRDRLAVSPFAAEARGRVILTGGASQMTGLTELAARILGRPVRIGRPWESRDCRTRQRARPSQRRPACSFIRRRRISNTSKPATGGT